VKKIPEIKKKKTVVWMDG